MVSLNGLPDNEKEKIEFEIHQIEKELKIIDILKKQLQIMSLMIYKSGLLPVHYIQYTMA